MSEQLADALASSAGGVVTVAVTYPIEIVKNKIASATESGEEGAKPDGAVAVARSLYKSGGLLAFYDGITVSAVENMIEKFIYFYAYSYLRNKMQVLWRGPSMVVDLTSGILAELVHLPLTIPLDTMLIKVVNNPKTGALEICRGVLAEKGLTGLYAGAAPSVLLSLKPALQQVVFEVLKERVLRAQQLASGKAAALSTGMAFVFGAVARAVATLVVFPYARAKFFLKNMPKGKDDASAVNPFLGMHLALWELYKTQGPSSLYNGLLQELIRGVTSAALLMAVREKLTVSIQRAMTPKV